MSLTILCSRDRCFRKLKYRITAHPVTNFVPSRDRFSPSAAFSNRTLNSMFLLKQHTSYIKKRYSITKIKYYKRNNFLNKYLDTKEYIIWNFNYHFLIYRYFIIEEEIIFSIYFHCRSSLRLAQNNDTFPIPRRIFVGTVDGIIKYSVRIEYYIAVHHAL